MVSVFSCQKDDDTVIREEKSSQNSKTNYSISKIDYQTVQQNNRLVNSITKIKEQAEIKNSNSQNRLVHSSTYNFYIETDIATYMENEDGNYHSYTFPIFRDNPTALLENLLFSLQADGEYKVSIVTYDITESEKVNLLSGQFVDLTNKISFEVIDGQALIDETLASMDSGKCSDVYFEYCTESADHSDGSTCGYIGSGLFTVCPAGGGDDGETDNPDNSDIPDGGGGSSGSGSPTDPNNDATSPTITISYEEQIINCLGTYILNGNSTIQTWLSSANQRDKKALANYLGSSVNSGMGNGGETNCSNPDALDFVVEAIEAELAGGKADFPNRVILDETFVNNVQLKCVYDKLTADNNTLFKNTVGAFVNDPNFNLTFRVGECATSDDQCTNDSDPNNIVITFEDVNTNPIEMAQAILHEAIHAELARYVALYQSGVDINNREYLFELYAYYKGWSDAINDPDYNWGNAGDHQYMITNYINNIANALRQFDNNRYPIDNYKEYAWDGLRAYDYRGLLTDTDEDNYINLRVTETNLGIEVCN